MLVSDPEALASQIKRPINVRFLHSPCNPFFFFFCIPVTLPLAAYGTLGILLHNPSLSGSLRGLKIATAVCEQYTGFVNC
jgi:hypothetical protein